MSYRLRASESFAVLVALPLDFRHSTFRLEARKRLNIETLACKCKTLYI